MSTQIESLRIEDCIDDNNNESEKSNLTKTLFKFKKTVQIDTVRADLICIEYSNKLFISITSTGKFGISLFIRSDQLASDQIYSVKTLFGPEESLLEVFGRSLAEKLKRQHSVSKPLLLSIGIEKKQFENIDLFHSFEKAILDFYTKE